MSLISTSLFSALMISTIKKGNIKSGFKYIPIFAMVSLIIYIFAQKIIDLALGVFIQF